MTVLQVTPRSSSGPKATSPLRETCSAKSLMAAPQGVRSSCLPSRRHRQRARPREDSRAAGAGAALWAELHAWPPF